MSNTSKEIVVELPLSLVNECDHMVEEQDIDRNTLFHQAISAYIKEEKNRKIKESMRRGYLEMKSINLDIASEAFQAEEEADTTLERSVSGV
ncbi:antitoxin [Allobacillus sp. GCM10007491]|uniref:Antitoxin n=1 Tax=Allobacillus saliphilus TaxID=2912308 RepID=A0A941HTA8_9BACI|nr:antitoxin [Allobacillus saliphilus]MBR7554636.1 antitoxin [Allobacillus saliphilus]